jgi:hypothetical protein
MFQSLAHRIVGNQPETTPGDASTETTSAIEQANDVEDATSSPNPGSPTSNQSSSVSETTTSKRNHLDNGDSDSGITW